jgi:hypothetical protein
MGICFVAIFSGTEAERDITRVYDGAVSFVELIQGQM